MTASANDIRLRLRALADSDIARSSQRFFKTDPGADGEGDRFLGVRVPALRKVARDCREAPVSAALSLLRSPFHEERLLALLLLVDRFRRSPDPVRARIFAQYLRHVPRYVDNWDLVDCSARDIVGAYLEDQDRAVLYELARAGSLWERRVAIIATFWFIKQGSFDDTLAIAALLLGDTEDLIHKAVGWMLREVGNRARAVEERFLLAHYASMPRTMLRYAIEKLPEKRRKAYLAGTAR